MVIHLGLSSLITSSNLPEQHFFENFRLQSCFYPALNQIKTCCSYLVLLSIGFFLIHVAMQECELLPHIFTLALSFVRLLFKNQLNPRVLKNSWILGSIFSVTLFPGDKMQQNQKIAKKNLAINLIL